MLKQTNLLWIDAAGAGVCALVSVVGYLALVGPFLQTRSTAADLSRQVETRQKKVAELESSLATDRERLTLAQQQLASGAVQLESSAHVNRRIADVTEFFAECRLHVDEVQTGRVVTGRQYDLVPITLVGRGPYPQCAKLLHGLCSKYPDMSLMRIELGGNPGASQETENFRFELFWYTLPSGPAQNAATETAGRSPAASSEG
jgi:Tfp pilus assembly protein PilO